MDEQIRAELARRAGEADVSGAARERVLRGVRPRRRWVRPVLGASLAVAATVALVAVVTRDAPLSSTDPAPSSSSSTSADGVAAGEWRDESWRGLTVSVPADWGWSAAPIGRNLLCDEKPDAPGYVGRPVGLTDACSTYRAGTFPAGEQAPYVWLGTDLEPGVVELPAEGWVQETVVAEGVTLTVASDDADLRAEILDSARPTGLCEPELADEPRPRVETTFEGPLPRATELTVCAYRRSAEGDVELTSAQRADDVAADTFDAIVVDDEQRMLRCASPEPASEWVVLAFSGPDPNGPQLDLTWEVVLHLSGSGCPRAQITPDTAYVLTPDMVAPWAIGAIPYTVVGPTGGKGAMIDSFIGVLG